MKKVELLAPAGDLDKLKIAILYGADAVFIGGKKFSLRAKASNFSIDDIRQAVIFANNHKAKIHVTVNIVLEEDDINELDDYLITLDKIGVHAIIVSSVYIMQRVKDLNLKLDVHVSTQQSIANSNAINFFNDLNVKRVVLARECNIDEIEMIKQKTNTPIEVFIHGGMCSSFSGRCGLSNTMVDRDANKGGCAHSCRWIYSLYENDKIVSNDKFLIGSEDLMSIDYIPKLISLGVDSFKIEGRMKSIHYIASIVSIYRKLIDECYQNKNISKERLTYYKKELAKAENRITSTGFLNPKLKHESLLLNAIDENPTQSFIGLVLHKVDKNGYILIEQRNYFELNDKIECIQPNKENVFSKIYDIVDLDGNHLEKAIHAKQILKIKIKKNLMIDSLIRKR